MQVYTLMHFEQQARKLPLRHADLITMNVAWCEHGAMRSYLKETPLYSPNSASLSHLFTLLVHQPCLLQSGEGMTHPFTPLPWCLLSDRKPPDSPAYGLECFVFGVQMSRGLFSCLWRSCSGWQKTPASQAADIFSAETLSLLYSHLLDVRVPQLTGRRGNAMSAYVSMYASCVTVRVRPKLRMLGVCLNTIRRKHHVCSLLPLGNTAMLYKW